MTQSSLRHYRWHDHLILGALKCIRNVQFKPPSHASRVNPSDNIAENLAPEDKQLSARLMRINHTGEVCAQALYLGQSLTTRHDDLKQLFKQAAEEEADHLFWCEQRLKELGTHQSILNPLWHAGSLVIGAFAGVLGDKWSLGFLAETEQQVFAHLSSHLERLSPQDKKSRMIIEQMRQDEAKHASSAIDHGAYSLPSPIKFGMQCMAKVMTSVVYYV